MAGKSLRFIGGYVATNLATALEYRSSLITQVLGMFVNDILWVAFWVLYFTKFPVLRGWTLEDVLVLWSSVALSAGLVMGLFTNSLRIPTLVAQGQLDYYLALPKDVLVHLLVSQIQLVNLGDLLFGPILLVVMVKLTWVKLAVFLATSLLGAVVMLGFYVLTGSLAFFAGNAETFGSTMVNTLMHFSTYPTPIFDPAVKFVLYTLIPAGFVTSMPVELVREFHWVGFLELLVAAVVFLTLAVVVFRAGLRRYESGNLMQMRS